MATVTFTPTLARHIDCPAREIAGDTVGSILARIFADNPRLRGYVLDDQGGVRKHVVIFVDGDPIHDRSRLSDAVRPDSEVFVMQALSGG